VVDTWHRLNRWSHYWQMGVASNFEGSAGPLFHISTTNSQADKKNSVVRTPLKCAPLAGHGAGLYMCWLLRIRTTTSKVTWHGRTSA
jgi:hypothetical protein